MEMLIQPLDRLSVEQRHLAGGKAATLARLAQAGYPVPPGFVILPAAFAGEALRPEAWAQIQCQLPGRRLCGPLIGAPRGFGPGLVRR